MATKNVNNIREAVNFIVKKMRWPLDVTGSNDFQQGDLLCRDTSSKLARAIASDADVATLLGVSVKPAYIAPYTTTSGGAAPTVAKQYDIDAEAAFGCLTDLYGTSGDTYHDGDLVYWGGVDAQTITNTKGANNNPIGPIKFPAAAMNTAQAYVAGKRYPVWVFAQYPFVMG